MNKFIFIVCSLFLSAAGAFGQQAIEKDLRKSFRNYELVKLDEKTVQEKAKTRQPIEVRAYGRYFQFVLTPNDLRAKNYRAVESTESGEREMEQSETTTYRGKLSGDEESEVRFNISAGGVEGFIYTGGNEKFFITKAERYSKSAAKSDAVVYGENDLIKTVDLSDDTRLLSPDIEEKIDFGYGIIQNDAFGSSTTSKTSAALMAELRELEVATEADYQWVSQSGGAAVAN
ncbi:MAG TPA: hypothetical protein VF692_04585, partial [Pyrinomonadaceae bacterium]